MRHYLGTLQGHQIWEHLANSDRQSQNSRLRCFCAAVIFHSAEEDSHWQSFLYGTRWRITHSSLTLFTTLSLWHIVSSDIFAFYCMGSRFQIKHKWSFSSVLWKLKLISKNSNQNIGNYNSWHFSFVSYALLLHYGISEMIGDSLCKCLTTWSVIWSLLISFLSSKHVASFTIG